MITPMQQIKAAFPNMPESDFGYYETDLHVKYTPELWAWLKANYEWPNNIQRFQNDIDGTIWIDIPFAYFDIDGSTNEMEAGYKNRIKDPA